MSSSTDIEYLASVEMWPVKWPIRGYALCNGALLTISENQALFSVIGNNFGGDGRITFALPNLQNRFPIGTGGDYMLGEYGGSTTTTLKLANLPQHTHIAIGRVKPGAMTGKGTYTNDPTNNYAGNPDSSTSIYGATKNTTMAISDVTVEVQPTGSNAPFNNLPPFLAMTYIIAICGIYPPRN